MKIRIGHVTNSSSSSFIIATNNEVDFESPENKKLIENKIDEILNYAVKTYKCYMNEVPDEIALREEISDNVYEIINRKNGLNLGKWNVTSTTVSNDDEIGLYTYLYDVANINIGNFIKGMIE